MDPFHAIRRAIKRGLERHGYLLSPLPGDQKFSELVRDPASYTRPDDFYRYFRPWATESFLQSLSSAVRANTMLQPLKLYMLLSLLKQTRSLDGAVLEAGVWNGGSARLIADYLDSIRSTKHLWLLDTFEGYDRINEQKDGFLATQGLMKGKTADEVEALFAQSAIPVHVIKGTIPGTLASVDASHISFAHIDVNLYEPTRFTAEFVLERMPRGGIIVFDDYNWPATYGVRQAIDETCERLGQQPVSIPESGQAFLVRN